MLSAEKINLSIYAIDDQIMLSSTSLKIGSEQAVYELARERAMSLSQTLWIAELSDADLVTNAGEIPLQWMDLVYSAYPNDFDESEFIVLANSKGYSAALYEKTYEEIGVMDVLYEVDHNDFFIESILWTREDVQQSLFDEGFEPNSASVEAVSNVLSSLMDTDLLKRDVLRSSIWQIARSLAPLSCQDSAAA